jgi:hypothetical protein
MTSLNSKQSTIFIEEETSKDTEVGHIQEIVGYIALWGTKITSQE